MDHTSMHHAVQAVASPQAMIPALFLTGLAGSVAHCAGMCSPFVVSQTITRQQENESTWQKLQHGALLPYHVGRMLTYVFLGFVVAVLTAQFRDTPWFQDMTAALLIVAGLFFLASAFNFPWPRLQSPLTDLIAAGLRHVNSPFLMGVMLGFLPCGLVYAATLTAAAGGNPGWAALGMVAFTLGTVPILMLAGISGRLASCSARKVFTAISKPLMVFNSLSLFVMAGELIR